MPGKLAQLGNGGDNVHFDGDVGLKLSRSSAECTLLLKIWGTWLGSLLDSARFTVCFFTCE